MQTAAQPPRIQIWSIDRLVFYARNPRKNDAVVDRMCSSIREFGFKIPVLARSGGEVVDGHLRLKAAQKLRITEVPVILCDEWSAAQVKAFRLMVNRSVTWAQWDDELLALELQELNEADFDLSLTGFDPKEIDGLLRIGFLYPQQIIWNKGRTVLTRTHYWYQHEPCWYVRKKNAPWFGKAGENSTIWDSASPKFIMGGSDEEKFDHPTQKPVDLMRKPILNHIKRGELVYEPFLGSGTTLAAAELTQRVCLGMELDPKYVDVIVQRWQTLAGKKATLDGDGRTFEVLAAERTKGAA